jgi:hypothetical protein
LSNLAPAVRFPELDGGAIVVGDVEHELQSSFGSRGLGSLDQLRTHAFSSGGRGYEQPAHDRKPLARLLQCLLPLRPGSVRVGRRERKMTYQLTAVLEDPGADRAMSTQPANGIGGPVRGIALCAVDRTQEDDQWLEVLVAAHTDHLLNGTVLNPSAYSERELNQER